MSTIAMVTTAVVGEYSLLVMPFILTAMIETHGVTEVTGGRLISLQLVAMAAGSLLLTLAIPSRYRRGMIAIAALIIVLANGLCAVSSSMAELVVARFLVGLGEGATMAAAATIIAGCSNPHRVFSAVGFAVAVVASIVLISVPGIMHVFGPRGIFWMLCLCPLPVIGLLAWLPTIREAPDAFRIPLFHRSQLGLLLAFGLLWMGASGLWVFAERIGSELGLSLTAIGVCLAVGQLAGIAGPLASGRWGLTVGLRPSLAIGNVAMAIGGCFFVFGSGPLTYTIGGCILSFFCMFLVPCFRSLMATLDPSGNLVSASAAFYTVGFAAAPALATLVLRPDAGYGVIALICGAFFVVAAVLSVMPSAPPVATAPV